ncbi:TlpA family protein disulfide reductase [Olivibacter sitiensis]|uniref:TlpA family protein disulfide reductase n=1 Tax=Olivibacter sitiensis TaxID=376470 RepID=UPI001FE0D8DF|nr:TlpA disulfide reductase family protein [Olivibacter sitiensis]
MCPAAAQTPEQLGAGQGFSMDSIKPLQIGDTIPEALWHLPLRVVNHPERKDTITLNDYRGKLIILDFWATWCSSCIAAMPETHEVEKEYSEDMVVIPISDEPSDKVGTFLFTNKTVEPLSLYSVTEDKLLKVVFHHRMVPHYAWISPKGELGATTTAERVNPQNIQLFLAGEQSKITMKKEIDTERPLFISDVIDLDDLAYYSVFTKGKYDGLPSGNRLRNENGVVRGRAITNSSILDIYRVAAYQLFEQRRESFNEKRLIINVTDTSESLTKKVNSIADSLLNYEIIVPVHLADSLYSYMLKDLNRYTNYQGYVENREIKCLILTKNADLKKIKSKGGKKENSLFFKHPSILRNYPLKSLIRRLNDYPEIPFLVVDETGYEEKVDLLFSGEVELKELKKDLNRQGLDLSEDYRTVAMFIIEDKSVAQH